MEARPNIKIELSNIDKILEILCLAILVLLWLGTIVFFSKLPDQIPSHYNASGQADDFSSKTSIFILPLVATVIYIGMTILNRYPHIYNYPTVVTAKNAKKIYTTATRLIRVLKLAVVTIFSGIVFMTIKTTFANGNELGAWFLPTAITLLIIPILYYLFKSSN